MVKQFTFLSFFLISSLALSAQTLVHYWNFNNSTDQGTLLAPTLNLVPGAAIAHIAGGISTIPVSSNTDNGFEVTNPNARNGDASGAHLRFNDPIGGGLLFSLPTTGYQQVVVKYATRRSGSGAGTQVVFYTTNGTDFDSLTVIEPVNGDPTLQTLDFSGIPAVADNANFAIRITFEQGSGGAVGNNRFDNFTLEGNTAGSDNVPPVVTFSPTNGAVDVSPSINPTITFSEDVRLVSDAAITDGDIPTLIDMRLNDAAGASVAFSGTIAGKVITIVPSAALANAQAYYIALNANMVEDHSNNAVATVQATAFTTIAPQAAFQPGDLVPVAYRMNASGGEDEIAFLTFVNILPGTQIKLTDTKYTDNAQAQCPGGLTWTAPSQLIPAGSVFVIQNDAGVASTGTVTGTTFGLSSGGDQVIVYTGTPDAASYITALSSNAWVSSPHTACSGSLSLIPAALEDGVSAINLSTAPGNTAGNTVNGYYAGPQAGTNAELRASILNPANWNGIGSGNPPQAWPTWHFPGPPQVTSALVTSGTTIQLVFNNDLDPASSVDLANYTGIAGLSTVSSTSNGTANDTVTLTYATPFVIGNAYTLTVDGVVDAENRVMLNPYQFTFNTAPTVSFAHDLVSLKEGDGDVSVDIVVQNPGVASSVTLNVVGASTAVAGEDYVLANTTVNIPANSPDTISVTLNLPENSNHTGGKYLILEMDPNSNAVLGAETTHYVLIADNDIPVPARQPDSYISLTHLASVAGNPNGGSAEISAYDPVSKRLFITNITNNTLDVLNFADPVAPVFLESVDLSSLGGGINSVAVKNGVVAVAIQGNTTANDGKVAFFDADGMLISAVDVGNLPDMVIFSHDGTKVLTANEGEPSSDYAIDPLGSVSVIDMAGGAANVTNANVTTLTFESFDGQIDALKAAGVRIYGPNATVGKDLEPEYICMSPDDKKAMVTLQENNAIAVIDLQTLTVTSIEPLGYKDHSQVANILDASDRGGKIFSAAWPIKGAYMPDALECFEIGGVTYAVTANEGDAREYGSFVESKRLGTLNLDPTAFPNASYLKKNELLGRLNVLSLDGDTDGDGDLDEIYSFGGRSFTIWNTATGELVWDSGDDLEAITAYDNPAYAAYFNAAPDFKTRSDDKGPEPEGVTIAEMDGRTFAFIAFERTGGLVAYEVTNPAAPEFIQYINTRTASGGDVGPEGIKFIPKGESPNGRNLLVLSNEVSGTVAVFQIDLDRTNGGDLTLETYDYTPTTTIVDLPNGSIFDGGISGLHYIPGTDLEFYAVSDRGPNADATNHPNATGTTLLFPAPDYAPVITRFKAENGTWTVQGIEEIKRPNGTPISGLPLPTGAGNTGETAWSDTTPTVLAPDVWGMDSEGIVEDNFGNLWLCDEYGASVWKINKTTKQVIKRYTPFPTQPQDAALPAVIGKRRPNRGFEGVAIAPNGKVYSMVQSVADNPNTAAGNNGRLLRLVEIDPETDAVRQFAYEIQPTTGQIRTRDWKVGDLVSVNNDEFLLVEHAERNGWNVKNVYKINIANATPLTTEDYGGQTMEQVGTAAALSAFGVNVVQKTLVLDLLEAGWDRSHDKPEGLTIIDDTTIGVVNDNDFGISSPNLDGTIALTGKTTRLYIFGLPEPLGYVSPYCTYDYPVTSVVGCEGDNIALDAGPGFTAYAWSNNATGQTQTVTAPGNISVTVTNDVGCKAIDSVTVVVNANPVIDLGTDAAFCSNEDFTLNPGAGFVGYLWSDGSQGQTFTATIAGTYGVVVEDANGCLGLDEITLTTLPAPVPDLGNPTQAICDGQFINLDAGAGFASYEWSTGATTQGIQVTNAGVYGVLVGSANGCFGSDVVEVVVNPTPDVNLGDNQTICEGATATLTAGAGFTSYAWSTGAIGQSINVTQTGTYSVVVSNSFGCTDLDAATVFVNPAPDIDLGPDTVVYEPNSYLLDAGGGFNQTYLWSNGSTGQTLTVTADGTYSVTVTNANGCTSTDAVTVSIEPNATHEATLAGKLNLFPNPTSGWVNLTFNEFGTGAYSVGVYDVTGRLLLSKNIDIQSDSQTAKLDLNPVAKGTYLVRVAGDKGAMAKRVVVQ